MVKRIPAERRTRYALSCDLGRMNDSTACVVVRRVDFGIDEWEFDPRRPDTSREKQRTVFEVPMLERLPLLLDYVSQVGMIAEMWWRVVSIDPSASLIFDATGCGLAVCDLARAAGLPVVALTLTSGAEATYAGKQNWMVPKRSIIQLLEAKIHSNEVQIASALPEAAVLRREFAEFRAGVTVTGALTFSHRVGQHDDLLLALAMGTWWQSRPPSGAKMIRLRGL